MSINCATSYLAEQMAFLLGQLKNGECRFLALDDGTGESTDDQGFSGSGYTARTTDFFPCSWKPVKADSKQVAELMVAGQMRALGAYDVTLSRTVDGADVVAKTTDRLELRLKTGDPTTLILEIVAVVNQVNVALQIFAFDIAK